MKKLTVFLLTLLTVLPTYGQNGLNEGIYFLLPKDKKTISLNTFENNLITEIRDFAINEKSIYATDKLTRVVILDTAKNNLILYNLESFKDIEISIPFNIKSKTVFLNKENIFVGGEMGEEILIQYHIANEKWFSLNIPKELMQWGKAIDDIVVNDSLLIAVDNIIMPKYILYYRLNSKDRLTFSHFKELKSNGPYESIYQGRITNKYFGFISDTYSGYSGSSDHITIYNLEDMTRSFAISMGLQEKNYHTFNDFAIIGDKVIIASKEKGLGIFDIKSSYFKGADKYGNNTFNKNVGASKIDYKYYKDENIIKLTILPNMTKLVVTIENKRGRLRNEIIEL